METATVSGITPTVSGLGGLPLLVRNARTNSQRRGVDRYVTAKFYEGRITADQYNDLIHDLWEVA